jgi:hypothetical protein
MFESDRFLSSSCIYAIVPTVQRLRNRAPVATGLAPAPASNLTQTISFSRGEMRKTLSRPTRMAAMAGSVFVRRTDATLLLACFSHL